MCIFDIALPVARGAGNLNDYAWWSIFSLSQCVFWLVTWLLFDIPVIYAVQLITLLYWQTQHLLCVIGQGWHTLVWQAVPVWSQERPQGYPGIPALCKGFCGIASIPDNHSRGGSSLSGFMLWKLDWAGVIWVAECWLADSEEKANLTLHGKGPLSLSQNWGFMFLRIRIRLRWRTHRWQQEKKF